MEFFSIEQIAVDFPGYPVSYVELIGTIFGLISVYLASRANIFTWSTGIVNEFFLFLLFFQVQLYPDMLLQLFFFATTLYGLVPVGKEKQSTYHYPIKFEQQIDFSSYHSCRDIAFGAVI